MRMGLVIGVLSLGILGLRAMVERRRIIGALRAIGYRRRDVVFGLMAEAIVTATIGVLVGLAAGAALGYVLVHTFFPEGGFSLERGSIVSALALVYGAVFFASLGPSIRASRLSPVEALRSRE